MKKIIILLTSLIMITNLHAQKFGEIHGTVLSKEDGAAVEFAAVLVSNGVNTSSSYTDSRGKFKIKTLNPGTYSLSITTIEYTDIKIEGIIVLPNDITILNNLRMVVGNNLEVVTISKHINPLVKVDNPTVMPILSSDIKKSANGKSTIGLVSQLPGITIGSNGRELYFKGSRPQSINTYIDGVKQIGSMIPSVPSGAIRSINVYTGGVPASYGDITGGVIIIETKSYMDFYKRKRY